MNDPERRERDADVLRRVLVGLRDGGAVPQAAGVLVWPQDRVTGRGWAGRGVRGGLPVPPLWAGHSVVEDGGVTHERVSAAHPLVCLDRWAVGAESSCPSDVSVSVIDRPGRSRWMRSTPTIQVEGGSYSLAEARRLVRVIEALTALVL